MDAKEHAYIAIDLKSFYASVECVERKLDPLTTNLVVADESRTEKTICLAVSPSLKAYGIPGRARLFDVISKTKQANPEHPVPFLIAAPRMSLYIEYSKKIYDIYLKYIAPEDIHVYSIDEVFMDVTSYLGTYKLSAHDLAVKIIQEVFRETGITATVGIGSNLYLCKIAMDIVAKHKEPDDKGARIAELDEMSYRKLLWNHQPLTDFWRVGRGYQNKLKSVGIYTMGDVARCSLDNEDLLYCLFGVYAELLIDHAWGYEPCTIKDIKNYKPKAKSLSSGQVFSEPYSYEKTKLVICEMADLLSLELVEKKLITDQIVLTIIYDKESLLRPDIHYSGEITYDSYGRAVPKYAHGTYNIDRKTSSANLIIKSFVKLYDRIINEKLLVRKVSLTVNNIENEENDQKHQKYEQLSLFSDDKMEKDLKREKKMQQAMLEIKKKYGKNAILKGMNLQKDSKARERNNQIGGHRA